MTHGKNKGRNRTLNLRVTDEEIAAARELGGGNISQGFRWALRYATEKRMRPMTLSTMLRACVNIATELEQVP